MRHTVGNRTTLFYKGERKGKMRDGGKVPAAAELFGEMRKIFRLDLCVFFIGRFRADSPMLPVNGIYGGENKRWAQDIVFFFCNCLLILKMKHMYF